MRSASENSSTVDRLLRDHVGADIRALRKSRGMTLADFSHKLDRSLGFVSQIERGLSEPTLDDLRKIAGLFSVPISLFFGDATSSAREKGVIVRGHLRRKIGVADRGLVEELLSPDLGGSFEIVRSEFAPGAELGDPVTRQAEEAGYVVTGRLDIEIDGAWFELKTGDSFRFENAPYRWRNPYKEPAVAIWVISPPVY